MSIPLQADAAQIDQFVASLFKHADEGSFISLRVFDQFERGRPPVVIEGVAISGDMRIAMTAATRIANRAAGHTSSVVFCPPIATFKTAYSAKTDDLANGVALSVEIDSGDTTAALKQLQHLLGPATIAATSGGEWSHPDTGEVHNKMHLHWRLSEPTRTAEDHRQLQHARWLAAVLVGADMSAAPSAHPLRWPGSWHTKATPKLSQIIIGNDDAEIHLNEAIEKLEDAVEAAGLGKPTKGSVRTSGIPQASTELIASAVPYIDNTNVAWDQWVRIGMAVFAASGGTDEGRKIWADWSAKSEKHDEAACDERWLHFGQSPPTRIGAGALIHLAKAAGWERPKAISSKAKERPKPKPRDPADPASIRVINGKLQSVVNQGEAALIAANLGIYQRSTFIVRPGVVRIAVASGRKVNGQRILPLGEWGLAEAMTTASAWERYDARSEDWVAIDVPTKVVKAYRDRAGHWNLPVLAGIINAPTLRADGSILEKPGYDEATGLLFDPQGVVFPPVPTHPSKEDAEASVELLKDLIEKFPFVGDPDRSVALSCILTAVARSALPTAPMHAFSAPVAGSGKSMIVDISSMIATGREAGVIAQGKSEQEFEKRLGSLLLAGDTVIAIDNVEEPLGGEFLCQVLTQTVVRARILGQSQAPELPSNASVTATGNNLVIIGDATRRTLLARLDPNCERPELRVFDHDPKEMIRADHGKYLCAALTILRAFHVAGRPAQTNPLGSFVEWSNWVRGSLMWLGQADPVLTMEVARESDPKLAAIMSVLSEWNKAIADDEVTTKTLIDKATLHTIDAFGRSIFTHSDFREALLAVAGLGGVVNSGKLAVWLRSNKDRTVGGLKIITTGSSHGLARWQLLNTKPAT